MLSNPSDPAAVRGTGAPMLRLDDLVGNSVLVEAPHELIVGRNGTFVIGEDDPYLHRRLLQIWYSAGQWMVKNIGTRVPVAIEPSTARSYVRTDLGPGAQTALAPGSSAVVFSTADRTYELHMDVIIEGFHGPRAVVRESDATATVGTHTPNLEQQELMNALAGPLAKAPGLDDSVIPDVATVAAQLGWTQKKVNSKIDYLCRKIEATGIAMPKPYRVSLARYALEMGYHR